MIYERIIHHRSEGNKLFAVLIDPDKAEARTVVNLARSGADCGVDLFLVGGSLLVKDRLDAIIRLLKGNCSIPVTLFPGQGYQISSRADAILLLSLISGRNADFLIDRHVVAAPAIRRSRLEVIPTGYMLFGNGRLTSVHYLSGTLPLPPDKPDIAVSTAMAGEMLGLKMLYLEAGSGAETPVGLDMIRSIRAAVNIPLVVGGGIRTPAQATAAAEAGADLLVVGTALEMDASKLAGLCRAVKDLRK